MRPVEPHDQQCNCNGLYILLHMTHFQYRFMSPPVKCSFNYIIFQCVFYVYVFVVNVHVSLCAERLSLRVIEIQVACL